MQAINSTHPVSPDCGTRLVTSCVLFRRRSKLTFFSPHRTAPPWHVRPCVLSLSALLHQLVNSCKRYFSRLVHSGRFATWWQQCGSGEGGLLLLRRRDGQAARKCGTRKKQDHCWSEGELKDLRCQPRQGGWGWRGGLAAGSEGEGAARMTHTVFADSVSVWTKREM